MTARERARSALVALVLWNLTMALVSAPVSAPLFTSVMLGGGIVVWFIAYHLLGALCTIRGTSSES